MQNSPRRKAKALLLDVFWPNRCDCCDKQIPYDLLICPECEALLAGQRICYADWAKHQTGLPWTGGAAVFSYAGAAKNGILAAKDGRRGFAEYAAGLLAEALTRCCPAEEIFCVTWVPVTKKRRRMQGYAHAEIIASALADSLAKPLRSNLLIEHAGTLRQHDLPAAARAQYAKRFTAAQTRLDGRTVILVDDILTTGNTLRSCTEQLLKQGAAGVYIAVICAGVKDIEKA